MADSKENLPAPRSSGLFDHFRKEMDSIVERFFGNSLTTAKKPGQQAGERKIKIGD